MKIINVGPKTDIKITDKSDIYNSGPTYVPVQIAPLQTSKCFAGIILHYHSYWKARVII